MDHQSWFLEVWIGCFWVGKVGVRVVQAKKAFLSKLSSLRAPLGVEECRMEGEIQWEKIKEASDLSLIVASMNFSDLEPEQTDKQCLIRAGNKSRAMHID